MVKLLVGLGNPGTEYEKSRHNLGWDALGRLIAHWGLTSGGVRFQGRWATGSIDNYKVLAIFPLTYMNLSGRSVSEAVRFYKLAPEQVIVLHDDLDLEPGRVRIKMGGGHAGHNGLRSIQELLGSPNFVRIRLGIGRPAHKSAVSNFVLTPFRAEEYTLIDPILDKLVKDMPLVLRGEFAMVLNRLALGAQKMLIE